MALNPVLSGAAQIATGQVSVGTTVEIIVSPRSSRRGIIIENLTGTDKVYIGTENGATTTGGYQIPAVANASIYVPTTAAVYGIVASTAQTVAYLEIYDQG